MNKTFISNARLRLVKNQTKSKQHPVAELSLFENYSRSSSALSSEILQKTNASVLMIIGDNENKV